MSKSLPVSLLLLLVAALWLPSHASAQAAGAQGPLPISSADPSWGSASAPVTLVHFSDMQCPFCSKITTTLDDLRTKYGPNKLRIVFKHMPLPFHKKARPAAEASVAVHQLRGNAAFWKFTEATFATIRGNDPFAGLSAVGLRESTVKRAMQAGQAAAKVDADVALAKAVGVRGTPASFVNGVFLSGARPADSFSKIIDEQLAEAAKLRRAGVPARAISLKLTKKNFKKPAARTTSSTKPTQDSTTVWKVPVGSSPQLGNRSAPVTLVVFSEFQCPFCKRLKPTLEQLRKDYGTDLRIVFKHRPLPFHKRAEPAAQLAIHAHKTKGVRGFWKAHDLLFERQRTLEDSDLEQIARDLGMNPAATMRAVHAHRYSDQLEEDEELAEDLNAAGTPHSFINGRRLVGAQPLARFKTIIDEELAHAAKLRAQGIPAFRLYAHIIKSGKSAAPPERKQLPPATRANPSKGPARAPVTITIFSDFECPFCGRALPTLERIEKEFPTQVRFVFRHKPLDFHKKAMLAHQAAAEAFAQGGNKAFWKMHDWLFAHQRQLDRSNILNAASSMGLDAARMDKAIRDGIHIAAIERDKKVSTDAGIRGTPGFVVNGEFISGAQPFRKFKRAIQRAMKARRRGARGARRRR